MPSGEDLPQPSVDELDYMDSTVDSSQFASKFAQASAALNKVGALNTPWAKAAAEAQASKEKSVPTPLKSDELEDLEQDSDDDNYEDATPSAKTQPGSPKGKSLLTDSVSNPDLADEPFDICVPPYPGFTKPRSASAITELAKPSQPWDEDLPDLPVDSSVDLAPHEPRPVIAEPSEAESSSSVPAHLGGRMPFSTGLFPSSGSQQIGDHQLENTQLKKAVEELKVKFVRYEEMIAELTKRVATQDRVIQTLSQNHQRNDVVLKGLGERMTEFDIHALSAIDNASAIIQRVRPEETSVLEDLRVASVQATASISDIRTAILDRPVPRVNASRKKMFNFH